MPRSRTSSCSSWPNGGSKRGCRCLYPLELKTAYLDSESIELSGLPGPATTVRARDALGRTVDTPVRHGAARLTPLPPATWRIEALAGDEVVARELCVVEPYRGAFPVPAFVTSTGDEAQALAAAAFARRLRATLVQVYDWMASYSQPGPTADRYLDPLGRPLSRPALRALNASLASMGAASEAYAPVYGADPPAAERLPALRLYGPDGSPQHLADLVAVMHPGLPEWIDAWIRAWAVARDLGFTAFHLDTYGYPHAAADAAGRPVDMAAAFDRFLAAVRAAFPDFVLTFNQVNTHPAGLALPAAPAARYAEIWPPNDGWRHLEGALARAGHKDGEPAILAIYPTVWGGGSDRSEALRTACLTQAVVTALGADTLLWGDDQGVLCDAYYPKHARLDAAEADVALDWHRFGLGVRDLLRRGRDTSWEDVGGGNRAVLVDAPAPALPEPVGGHLFVRVRRGPGWLAVSLLDLTGSARGLWTEPTADGRVDRATVCVPLPGPGAWRAAVAHVGVDDGVFRPADLRTVPHDEGTALAVDVTGLRGWAVVRLSREDASW